MDSAVAQSFDEGEQVGIEDVGMDGQHAVRIARIDPERAVLHQLDAEAAGVVDRHHLVVVAMQDENAGP